jgi:hypothetical protein
MDIPTMAGTTEDVVKTVMKVEPMVAGIAGMFIPGLFLVQPWIVMIAPFLEQALEEVKTGNGGAVLPSILDLINHLSKGAPNASALAGPSTADDQAATAAQHAG